MSDDFDQDDDLAWLRGDDEDEPGDDEEQFDWQEEKPGSPAAPPGGHLGFTTELPWMGDESEQPGATSDEEEDYTWLQAADAPEQAASEDFELDWLLQKDEPEPEPPPEQPGWLKRATSELEAVQPEEVPEWLNRPDQGDDLPEADEEPESTTEVTDEEIAAGPDWLQEPAPTSSAEEIDINEVPDWLQGAEAETPRRPASMLDESGQLSADWLASGAQLSDSAESEQSFDEWYAEQEELERVPDLEEQMPDLGELAAPEDANSDEIDTGALPDWYLGMEELDVEDAPDWFTGDRPPTDQLGDSPITDWLAAQEQAETPVAEPEPETPEAMPQESGLGEDFFADMTAEIQAEEAALEADFFGSLGSESANTLDDIFAALGEEEPETPPPAAPVPDEPDVDIPAVPAAADEEMANFFATLRDDEVDEPLPPGGPSGADVDALGDDFFTMLGVESGADEAEEAADEPLPDTMDAIPDGDFLQSLGIETPDEEPDSFDWFALEDREPETIEEEADWLQDLSELDAESLATEALDLPAEELEPLPEIGAPGLDDIDSLLASMGGDLVTLPDTGNLLAEDVDFDSLFSDPAFSGIETPAAPVETDISLQPDSPEWLSELGATVGGISAAAILRQRDDRPLEELPDRLKRLRERGASSAGHAADPDALSFTPDMGETAATVTAPIRGASEIILTPDQSRRVNLLKQLAASEQATAAVAARAISDEPFLLDEDESLPTLELDVEGAVAPTQRRVRLKIDRLLIALAVAIGVILPFVTDLRFGDLPPAQFAAGSRQEALFASLDSLNPGDQVLVAMEYGPAAAPELDGLARALLQHILLRRAQPVVVSSDPVGLLRADHLLADLARADSPVGTAFGGLALHPNEDYFVTRVITGGMTGLRALAGSTTPLLANDLTGLSSGLNVTSLNDFARVVIVAERPDDLHLWAEQIAPQTGAPILAATGYIGEPLIEPYVGSSLRGLLVGFKDSLTYQTLLTGLAVPEMLPLSESTEAAPSNETPIAPTDVPLEAIGLGVIVSDQNVNVRIGPDASFPVVGRVTPGQLVDILAVDASWVNIRLADGTEGWVASNLVEMSLTEATQVPIGVPPTATSAPTNTRAPTEPPASVTPQQPTATLVLTDMPAPTEPPATATPLPTEVPPTAIPTTAPTLASSATPQPEGIRATVIADNSVNVRSGPGTTSAPIGRVYPGDEVVILGRNADGTWLQIEYPDVPEGQEAWMAAFLVDIDPDTIPAVEESSALILVMAGSDLSLSHLLAQDAATPTLETAPAEPVEATEAVEPATPAPGMSAGSPAQAEQRWYAMNVGLVVIIVVILFGTLVNIARAVLRRGR